MGKRHIRTAVGGLALLSAGLTAPAAWGVQHDAPHTQAGLEAADGTPLRPLRLGTAQSPAARTVAWQRFKSDVGGKWLANWDEATLAPTRIFGSGIAAPGTSASPALAEAFARQMLERHIALFAPGAGPSDFQLVSNVAQGDKRTVAFVQHHRGMAVVGGQLSFRFSHNRLSVIGVEALPSVDARAPHSLISDALALSAAEAWIGQDAQTASASAVSEPMVLPMITSNRVHSYRTVVAVEVQATAPIGKWTVYIDADTGAPVAREQTLRFAEGTVLFNTPVRHPGAERSDFPAPLAKIDFNGDTITSDENGQIAFPDGTAEIVVSLKSSLVSVFNSAGDTLTEPFTLNPGDSVVWNEQDEELSDSQLTGYIHAHKAKEYARKIAPEMNWLDAHLPVNVNVDDVCNAFYDGSSINFFRSGQGCQNTGRLADVVYHEFGHGFHHHAIITGSGSFESALSEGLSDFYAANLTGDPGMGRGFFFSEQPLRHIDPEVDKVWPQDIHGDPHQTGLIIAGALWDLRELLIDKYGHDEGVAVTEQLFYLATRNASDIPTMYVEALAADDDDGNLENGTPNVCEIVDAFGRHGLRTLEITAPTLSVEPPLQDDHHVAVEVLGLFEQCTSDKVDSASIEWRLRRNPNQKDVITMAGGPELFEGDIPAQQEGEVVLFKVRIDTALSSALPFPNNAADPLYEFFVGDVTPIYCTDFETDPEAEGWTHGLTSGDNDEGADDWQWGAPAGTSTNGDPPEAFSGSNAFGNDLGHGNFNGLYQPNKVNYARSPKVDVTGIGNVRLQYRRWLSVEDGHFDAATIYVNGEMAWSNHASANENDADIHHQDREWRFQDIDLSKYVDDDGSVQVEFEIASDQGLNMGGWTIDDFCIVAYEGSAPNDSVCGNGVTELGETCDDGNVESGDGCSSLCAVETGNSAQPDDGPTDIVVTSGCGCHTASTPDSRWGWLALLGPLMLWSRRRRGRLLAKNAQ